MTSHQYHESRRKSNHPRVRAFRELESSALDLSAKLTAAFDQIPGHHRSAGRIAQLIRAFEPLPRCCAVFAREVEREVGYAA